MDDLERTTTTVQTPAGKDLVTKEFITARERNVLRGAIAKNVEVKDGQASIESIDVAGIDVAEREMINAFVISYDGITENVTDKLLDGTPAEYDFVIGKCNELLTANFTSSK